MSDIFHGSRIARLKNKIEKSPYLGEKSLDGTYLYKEGRDRIRYRIAESNQAPAGKGVEWLKIGLRPSPFGEGARGLRRTFANFRHYQGWLNFLNPSTIITLVVIVLLLYFGLIERQRTRIERYRWIIAKVVGIRPEQVEYIGDGWVEVGAKRKTAVDRQYEPVTFRFNPIRWLFHRDAGYVDRWRGDTSTTHKVSYNDAGDVWLEYEKYGETEQHGVIVGNEVRWDSPLGKAHRAEKISGEEISIKEGGISISDIQRR